MAEAVYHPELAPDGSNRAPHRPGQQRGPRQGPPDPGIPPRQPLEAEDVGLWSYVPGLSPGMYRLEIYGEHSPGGFWPQAHYALDVK
jgi:hypothetical protein